MWAYKLVTSSYLQTKQSSQPWMVRGSLSELWLKTTSHHGTEPSVNINIYKIQCPTTSSFGLIQAQPWSNCSVREKTHLKTVLIISKWWLETKEGILLYCPSSSVFIKLHCQACWSPPALNVTHSDIANLMIIRNANQPPPLSLSLSLSFSLQPPYEANWRGLSIQFNFLQEF